MLRRPFVPVLLACLGAMAAVMPTAARQSDEADRIRDAATVLKEIMDAPDRAIPRSIGEKAEAVAVFPSTIKAGFIVGGQRGRGVVSVRDRAHGTPPLPHLTRHPAPPLRAPPTPPPPPAHRRWASGSTRSRAWSADAARAPHS